MGDDTRFCGRPVRTLTLWFTLFDILIGVIGLAVRRLQCEMLGYSTIVTLALLSDYANIHPRKESNLHWLRWTCSRLLPYHTHTTPEKSFSNIVLDHFRFYRVLRCLSNQEVVCNIPCSYHNLNKSTSDDTITYAFVNTELEGEGGCGKYDLEGVYREQNPPDIYPSLRCHLTTLVVWLCFSFIFFFASYIAAIVTVRSTCDKMWIEVAQFQSHTRNNSYAVHVHQWYVISDTGTYRTVTHSDTDRHACMHTG
eukprot:251069-Amorphochlora_amoeboformis.AAC.2